ncbi:hypothetical protein VTH8203_03600 [Vibrio thalassae]|uniref:Uncharacterized protein n=1 Tax=Vibrio thalassae TaxID=1243014 RepID=A0A240EMP0_9VIBR|nr:hypothetical protein [Vibrio thalassae]SNX49952.1 hypothetical protein VTH8203_03600 [Vibrio thalassae]
MNSGSVSFKGDKLVDKNGKVLGTHHRNADGSHVMHDASTGEVVRIDVDNTGQIRSIDHMDGNGDNTNYKVVDNDMMPTPMPSPDEEKRPNRRDNDQNNHDDGRFNSIADAVVDQVNAGNKVKIGEHEISRNNIGEVAKIVKNMSDEQKKRYSSILLIVM